MTINTTGVDPKTIASQVTEALNQRNGISTEKAAGELTTKDGGVDVADNETKVEVEETQTSAVVEQSVDNAEVAPTAEETPTEATEEAPADNSEVAEEVDLQKMFAGFAEDIKKSFEATKTETATVVADLKKSVEETTGELSTKISDLETRLGALDNKVSTTEKRVDSVEGETAMKKSADLGGADDNLTKNNNTGWDGAFLSVSNLS